MSHSVEPTAASAVRRALGAQRAQLLAVVRRRGGARIDAEDVLQAALERALERADQVRDPERAEAWIGRVVRNAVFDELRKRRVTTLPADDLELAASDVHADEGGVDCRCVLAQAERLKPEYATILRRVVVDGVSVTDVARELGVTPNNAMVRLHRARNALRTQIAAHCGTTSVYACSGCGCEERGCCVTP